MDKRLVTFLELLVWGVMFGVLEDFILIQLVTEEAITWDIFFIVLLVTFPFAMLGEYIIDRIDFLKLFRINPRYKGAEIFFEFLIFGIAMGVFEDLTAFYFAIGDAITPKVFFVAALIAIPFAFIGEFLIDRIDVPSSLQQKKLVMKSID